MNIEDKNKLINLLDSFFANYDINERDVLSKNDIAKYLKKKLSEKQRWKNLPRGKPNNFS